MDLRSLFRSVDAPDRENVTLRNAFKLLSMVAFFAVAAVLLSISLTSDIVVMAILAGVFLSQMLYVILPMETIRARARRLWTGEAGAEAYDELEDRGGGLL